VLPSHAGHTVGGVLSLPVCAACGLPGGTVCAACRAVLVRAPHQAVPHGLDSCRALLDYDDVARALLTGLKNRHRRDLVATLADALAGLTRPAAGTVVTWAPTGAGRRRARGYDQAHLLAAAVARRWHAPLRACLQRSRGPAQAGRSAAERRQHPGFTARGPIPASVVVLDDVATTGATLTAAARALRAAGAVEVHALVVARAR
jgi:ComF family protein